MKTNKKRTSILGASLAARLQVARAFLPALVRGSQRHQQHQGAPQPAAAQELQPERHALPYRPHLVLDTVAPG